MRLLILSLLCSFVYLLALQTSCFAAKFTMFPMVGRSHYLVLARIGEELESRGHEVKYKCSWRSPFITTYKFSKFFGSISNLLRLVRVSGPQLLIRRRNQPKITVPRFPNRAPVQFKHWDFYIRSFFLKIILSFYKPSLKKNMEKWAI